MNRKKNNKNLACYVPSAERPVVPVHRIWKLARFGACQIVTQKSIRVERKSVASNMDGHSQLSVSSRAGEGKYRNVRIRISLFVVMNVVAVEDHHRLLRDVHPVVYKVLGRIVRRRHPRRCVRALDLKLDMSMVWLGAGLAIVAAVLLAYVPRLPTANTSQNISSGGVRITGGTSRRLRIFAVTQIAASFILLAGASMLIKTLLTLQATQTGFDMRRVLVNGLPRFTAKTITEWPALIEALRHVRRNGYAMDDEEYQPGVICVGAPIRDHNGAVVGAISASTPAMRANDGHLSLMREQVVSAVRALSAELGAHGSKPPSRVAAE